MFLTPALVTAFTMSVASLTVFARGFSQITCLPALAASMAMIGCRKFGVQMSTTSISGRLTVSFQSRLVSCQP